MIKVSKTILIGRNKYIYSAEGKDVFEAHKNIQEVGFYGLQACPLCQSDLLSIRATVTDKGGYEYLKVHCGKCKAQLTMGKTKKDGTYYYRRRDDGALDWQEYKPQEKQSNANGWDESEG